MSFYPSGPTHTRAKFVRPQAYRATVADPPRFPRPVILRSSCGHTLGVGYVFKHQGYMVWRSSDA